MKVKVSCKDYDDAIKFRFMSCAPDRAGPGGTSSSKLASFARAAALGLVSLLIVPFTDYCTISDYNKQTSISMV